MSRGLARGGPPGAATASSGFLTITGGKLTTFRLMAEIVVDAMCEQLGEDRPCRTADEVLPGSEERRPLLARLAPGGPRRPSWATTSSSASASSCPSRP